MTSLEFSNEFEILYNNIMSNQSPGIDEYEKSVFLTKAQLELVKNYFNPRSNKIQEGYDDSAKRQYDFSVLNTVKKYLVNSSGIVEYNEMGFENGNDNEHSIITHLKTNILGEDGIDNKFNRYFYQTPDDFLFFINEEAFVERVIPARENLKQRNAAIVTPINFNEYTILRGGTYKYPVSKNECWKLITNKKDENEIIAPYNYKIVAYTLRYVRKPKPIILTDILSEYGTTIDGEGNTLDPVCELPEAIHPEIVQRAVELAKAAYRTGETDVLTQMGTRSE